MLQIDINDLSRENKTGAIADCTLKTVESLRHDESNFSVFKVPKGERFPDKTMRLSKVLKDHCSKKNITLINYDNILRKET